MNREETVKLTRYIKAVCPQQTIDDYTPNAWHDLLADLTYADAVQAVRTVGARQPFVAPAEIRAEVTRIRAERLQGFQYVPVEGDDDPQVYLAAYRAQRAAVAAGEREPAPAALDGKPRDVKALLAAFRRPE